MDLDTAASLTISAPPLAETRTAQPTPEARPWHRVALHWMRRLHLYFGLFLLPWAVLYGVTAFLFNHPTVFSDQPTTLFGKEALAGTPLEGPPSPQAIAEQVVARLNEAQKPQRPYALAGAARYGREFAFATVKADGQTLNVLIDLKNGGGTVRATPIREQNRVEPAPFAVGNSDGPGRRSGRGPGGPPGGGRGGPSRKEGAEHSRDGIKLDNPLHEQVKVAVLTILERTDFPTGEVNVTSVPDVVFPVEAGDRTWTAWYSPMTGAVSGTPAEAKPEAELGWRRFLLRLHTAHGYPGETNARWFWALIVDAMAVIMCFWGLSGLVMWWQIKATRKAGGVILVLSAAAAAVLGLAMHAALTA